jgi:hypothetical protein
MLACVNRGAYVPIISMEIMLTPFPLSIQPRRRAPMGSAQETEEFYERDFDAHVDG